MATNGIEEKGSAASPSAEIDRLFRAAIKLDGSDLHLKYGRPPYVRVDGVLRALGRPALGDEELQQLCNSLLSDAQKGALANVGGVDLAYTVRVEEVDWRFRVNVFRQTGHVGLVARKVRAWIPTFEELHLPASLAKLCGHHQGMVLLSGATGSGKSTTIAAMLDYINHASAKHIVTLEDPIEFLFREDKCLISQRDVGLDVIDYETALRQVVREDPDVILVGEMRDRATFTAAMQAAETGHLVFATTHASSAPTTIARILEFFPAEAHRSVRDSMAANMQGIICQRLLPSIKPGTTRVPAVEVMLFTSTVRKLIRDGEEGKLTDAIRIGVADGMQDYTESLKRLVEASLIDRQVAFDRAANPDALKMALKGIAVSERGIL
jgi:twitching motility protein PilT